MIRNLGVILVILANISISNKNIDLEVRQGKKHKQPDDLTDFKQTSRLITF